MELHSGEASAVVDPQGGRLASLSIGAVELLVTGLDRPTRWGSFPMVPWCGRLRDGHLQFDGRGHDFPITSPPHANHGFGHLVPWDAAGPGELRLDLSVSDTWPFGGEARQWFELADDHLTVTIEVQADERPFPAMAGWHPWFRKDLGVGGPAELSVDVGRASVYELDDTAIPTGALVPVPPGPWDNCFVGLAHDPVIRWPGALELTVSSTFDHWVIYTQPEHALCVEPQSGAPNDTNRDPFVVRPGEPLVGSMTLAWR